jgi:indole-3-glycerol phosphate synthase
MKGTGSLLARILNHKHAEVATLREQVPLAHLAARVGMAPPPRSFAAALRKQQATALIAEVKKASPSRGVLLESFDHMHLAQTYMAHGAAALSVLTDEHFFQGNLTYLQTIRNYQSEAGPVPLLRKDFLLDPYQVYEARLNGADAVLLIVAALDGSLLRELLELTHTLGMDALVEVHTEEEMRRALDIGARIVGINNRDLHTFTTNLATTEWLASLLPGGAARPVLVSESGIHTPEDVARLRACGVDAILVGEALVTAPDIGARVRELAGA